MDKDAACMDLDAAMHGIDQLAAPTRSRKDAVLTKTHLDDVPRDLDADVVARDNDD